MRLMVLQVCGLCRASTMLGLRLVGLNAKP